ncbi:acyl-CoA thioesterase [bacterium]|jgi:acyl-CoA thioester hydrolase|nr:acyl-CoA thioesterase [bacterium]
MPRRSEIFFSRFDVPFDDLDAGGVLYNANYLRYCDRARNQVFAASGWTWDRMVANKSVLAVVGVEAEYRRAVRQGTVWVATMFTASSDRFLEASQVFIAGDLPESEVRAKVMAHAGPLEKMRGVHFRSRFKLVPIAIGDFVPGTLDPDFVAAVFG